MKALLILIAAACLAACAAPEEDHCTELRFEQDWAGIRQVCTAWSVGHAKELTRPEYPRMEGRKWRR